MGLNEYCYVKEHEIWGILSFRMTPGKFWTSEIWPPEVGVFLKKARFFALFHNFENTLAGKGLAQTPFVFPPFFSPSLAALRAAVFPVDGEFMLYGSVLEQIYCKVKKDKNVKR